MQIIKRKRISKAIFILGFAFTGYGICMRDTDFILAIRMMLGGVIVAWIGWLLTEYYEWREERKHDR